MEVRKGYKQTEVGVIPEDWDVQPVGEAYEIHNNLRLPISRKIREQMEGPYPYYGPTSVQGYINEYRVEGEYALIGEDGDHFLKWRNQPMTLLVRGQFNVNNHAHLVKGTKNLTKWFYYYFAHRDITPHLTRQGAGRYKLTKRTLLDIPCALPPTLAEQEAIAEALSDADALIESLETLLAKKRQVKQGAMSELLTGKRRLPGFSGEWEVKELDEVAEANWGNTAITKTSYRDSGFVAYSASGPDGFVGWYEHDLPAVVLSAIGAQCGKTWLATGKWTPIKNTIWFRAIDGKADTSFLYWITGDPSFWANRGQAQPFIALGDVRKSKLHLPSIPEQTAIAEILSDMDAEIRAVEEKLSKARAVKAGMMSELLGGRIRLNRD